MSRPQNPTPSYLLHKKSGQARVRLRVDGRYRDIYLGDYGSAESYEKYRRVLVEYLGQRTPAIQGKASAERTTSQEWTVAELAVAYDDFARSHYLKEGKATDDRYRAAIPPLVTLFGSTLVREFGPKKLKTLREDIIERGNLRTAVYDKMGSLTKRGEPLCRDYVNNLIKSVTRMFKWAVTEEKCPAAVPDALAKVSGLRKGRDSRVREPNPIRPVPDEHFEPVVAASSPQIAAMLQIQRLTGMRPDEVTRIRPCDIDMTSLIWVYRPNSHKLDWLNQKKEVLIGPRAQAFLSPWLDGRDATAYAFSPREVAAANAIALEKRRKRPRREKVWVSTKRPPGEHYDDRGYRQAVVRACHRAGVPEWSPGRLRHSAGTEIRKKYGAE